MIIKKKLNGTKFLIDSTTINNTSRLIRAAAILVIQNLKKKKKRFNSFQQHFKSFM